MLEVRNVSVMYGRVQALNDVSVRLDAGELVVLLGANGAGKSTTLRVLSGLVSPVSGVVEANESERVAHVLEGRGVFPRLSVEQNLLVGLYPRRRERPPRLRFASAWRREALDEVLERFSELRDRTKQRAGTLSGGEQQILVIARALMSKPKLLLIDEPSHGLAPRVVTDLFDLFAELKASGLGILVVEQYVTRALRSADRAYVLEKGKIAYEGSPSPLIKDRRQLVNLYLGRTTK